MKKFLKSSLSLLLAITLIFSSAYAGLSEIDFGNLFAVKAKAANVVNSGTCGENLTWTLDDEGTLTISGTGDMMSLWSSSSVPWYSSRESVMSVVVESGVTSISNYAFCDCESLTSVTIGNSVTSIGDYAFYNCTSLTSIDIPDGVISVGNNVFRCCTILTSITIPDSVTYIGESAFSSCTSLTSINIPEGVTSIGDATFADCNCLTSINIPDSVTSIGDAAFSYCTSITTITIPDGVTSIGDSAFSGCSRITTITIPDSVTNIGSGAFSGCSELTTITIPAGVRSIGDGAFSFCIRLASIEVDENNSYYSSVAGILFDKDMSTIVRYPIYKTTSSSYSIPDSVTSIGGDAFSDCAILTSITIPDGVTSIGDSAFSSSGITTINIPDSVTSIGSSAFAYCEFTSITIPDSVTSIGYSAFSNCWGLTSIIIPDSVTSIGSNAFSNTPYYNDSSNWINNALYIGNHLIATKSSIAGDFVVKEGTKTIAVSAFNRRTGLTSITIPDSVTSIGDNAFSNCTSLTSITISDSVTNIGNYAFSNCTALEKVYWNAIEVADFVSSSAIFYKAGKGGNGIEIVFGDTVKKIPAHLFYVSGSSDRPKVTSVTIGENVISIGDYAFYCCTSLTSIDIPEGVISIGDYAFSTCTSLTSIDIPDGVISIGDYAFEFARGLSEVTIGENVTSIGDFAFRFCTSLASIIIPGSVTFISANAFYNCSSDFTIYCYRDTYAMQYAIDKGFAFVLIGSCDEHTESDWIIDTDATCTENGSKHKECLSCGTTLVTEVIYAIGEHSFGDVIVDVPANCISGGSAHRECSLCGYIETVVGIPNSQHNWGEPIIDKPPTCVESGEAHQVCSVCDSTKTITLEPIEHDYSGVCTVLNKPTCTEYATLGRTCVNCGDVQVTTVAGESVSVLIDSDLYPESSHNYESNLSKTYSFTCEGAKRLVLTFSADTFVENNWDFIYIYDETGTQVGKYTGSALAGVTITLDGDSFSLKLTSDGSVTKYGFSFDSIVAVIDGFDTKPLGHKYSTEWTVDVEPTCTNNGSKSHHCTVCDHKGDITVVDALGHSYGDWIVDAEPTCTEDSSRHKTCSTCGDIVTEPIVATGHNYSTEWTVDVEPTCTQTGSKSHHCTVCGDKGDITVVDALGHSYGDWIVDAEPTCTENGARHKTCSTCGDIVTETIVATGHDYATEWIIDVEPTCTQTGSKSHHCTVCGDKGDITVVDALGHSYGDWIVDEEATCTTDGSRHKTCSRCGDIVAEPIVSPGHDYSTDWIIDSEATCVAEGSKSRHCSVCGDKTDVMTIPTGDHTFLVVSAEEGHPHFTEYKCAHCPETKQENVYLPMCALCNFTYTNNDDGSTCRITGYIGESPSFVMPADILGRTVVNTTTGAFRNLTNITSVTIEDGVTGIGSVAFMGCSSLSKIIIPASVKSIGAKAFLNCASDFTIYCYRGSTAMTYAINNSHNYFIMDVGGVEGTTVDYDKDLIFTNQRCANSIDSFLYIPETSATNTVASMVCGNKTFIGTGSVVTVYENGNLSSEYTVVVDGDTNGDSACDALDAAQVALVSSGYKTLGGAYRMAADDNSDEVIDIADYQAIVNKTVS